MKTGLTIQQMAQELLRQSKAKQDYLVNTGSLSLSVTTDAPQLRVTENGLDKIAPLDIRQTAHRQLGTYLGIPQKYYELMRTDAPELLAYNANYWFSQKNELRTLRTMDGCARAFLSNRYRRIDNLDIASVTLPVIGELPEARFVSTQITDDFMYIKVVNPRLQADVVPGDVVQAGVIISNSETGLGSVTIQPLIYRLVCSNGMVINDAKTRRNHVGRAATSDEDFSIYSNETLLADDHAFVLKIKDTVRAAISEARFAQAVSRMRESTEAMLDTKQLPAIVKLASSSFGITEDESNGVLEHLITGGDFSLYGLANAVTRFSQDVESYRGKYYTLTDQRIPYRRDKTEDERFFILTLFAIAHEIEAMGQYSGSLMRVQLAVGLPPAHFGVQAKRFINYFNGRGAVAFQFKGKPYAIFIENTACFPQSFSAAAATVKNLASFPRALVVDIGGFTADYVRLRNGVPDMAACDSLENGVILLYNRICAKANAELDILLEESEIDRILRGEDQDAAPEVIALAEREAQEFINDLLSGLRERMLELKSGKVIFLGGGATLLRRQIEASGKIGQAIFVEDINANAKGYEYLYRLQHSGR